MSSSARTTFSKNQVEDYERRRYRGLDQRLVHSREVAILSRIMRDLVSGPLAALDAPCGYGRFTAFLRQRSARLVSSDLSPAMVERAVTKPGSSSPSQGVVADLKLGLPFLDGSFDLVFSLRFFHHVQRPDERTALLREYARVSRRWAIVSFYRMNALHRLERWLRRRVKRGSARIKMVAKGEFEDEARKAGWRVARRCALLRGVHAQHIALLEKRPG